MGKETFSVRLEEDTIERLGMLVRYIREQNIHDKFRAGSNDKKLHAEIAREIIERGIQFEMFRAFVEANGMKSDILEGYLATYDSLTLTSEFCVALTLDDEIEISSYKKYFRKIIKAFDSSPKDFWGSFDLIEKVRDQIFAKTQENENEIKHSIPWWKKIF